MRQRLKARLKSIVTTWVAAFWGDRGPLGEFSQARLE